MAVDTKKLKMHLQAALDCLEGDGAPVEDAEVETTDDDSDDVTMKSMKMKMQKYAE